MFGGRVKRVRLTSRDLHDRRDTSPSHLPGPSRPMRRIVSSAPGTFTHRCNTSPVWVQSHPKTKRDIAVSGPRILNLILSHRLFGSKYTQLRCDTSIDWVQGHPVLMRRIDARCGGSCGGDVALRFGMSGEVRRRCGVAVAEVWGGPETEKHRPDVGTSGRWLERIRGAG